MNAEIDKRNLDRNTFFADYFPERRIRRVRRMPGEQCRDHVIDDPLENYRIRIFNVTIDNVIVMIRERFDAVSDTDNNTFFAGLALLDPKNFESIRIEDIKSPMFESLCQKIVHFDKNLTPEILRLEFKNLCQEWETLKRSPLDEFEIVGEVYDDIEDEITNKPKEKHQSCKKC